jgi:uncharacterized MAPEG superfamily protein
MTVPLFCLLGFAVWTHLVLVTTIGVHRWTQVLTGRAPIHAFRADRPEGPSWYRRAMRAHANCVENLPVFGAVVVTATLSGLGAPLLGHLSAATLAARVCQSVVHIVFVETARTVSIRFTFFTVQVFAMLTMAFLIVGTR